VCVVMDGSNEGVSVGLVGVYLKLLLSSRSKRDSSFSQCR
jgi:hypothetical protein